MEIRPFKKQCEAKAIADKKMFTLYGGGIRGGKSFWLILTLLSYCFQYDRSRWIILRKDLPTMRRTILVSFMEIINNGFQQYIKSFDLSTLTCTFNNGSVIIFMAESYDTDKELNRFRGLEINGAAIDEINEIQEKTFYKVIERAGSWNGAGNVKPKIIATCNPTNNWVKEAIYDKWKNNTIKDSWAYVPALITDNPHINPDYLNSLIENMPPHQYEIFVKGNWDVKLEGSLFDRAEMKWFTKKGFEEYLKEHGEKVLDKYGKDTGVTIPDQVIGYIDPANEGDDYLAYLVGKMFKDRLYITDVIYTKEAQDKTIPRIIKKINDNNVSYTRVETNGIGSMFVPKLREYVQPSRILASHSSRNKHVRILDTYWFILEYCYFLEESEYEKGSDYDLFIKNVLTYQKADENTEDDGIDGLAGLCMFAYYAFRKLFTKKIQALDVVKK